MSWKNMSDTHTHTLTHTHTHARARAHRGIHIIHISQRNETLVISKLFILRNSENEGKIKIINIPFDTIKCSSISCTYLYKI